MLKNIQFNKIILILFIIGIIIISGLGVFFLNSLNHLSGEEIKELQNKTIGALAIAGVLFALVGIITASILSKYLIYPINKLIESAEKIAEEENKIGKKMLARKKGNEAQNLENVLGIYSKKSN